MVKIDPQFDFAPYLHYFDISTQQKITAYYHYGDRVVAFTSHLLKHYYLAAMLKTSPAQLKLGITQYKKPVILAPQTLAQSVQFNIAHTREYVVLAVSHGSHYQIGVDIECIDRKLRDVSTLSRAVFSAIEQAQVAATSENFFKLWTKKEALIKAHGTGFMTDFYRNTQLNLDDTEINLPHYLIHTIKIANHFLSLCLAQSK